MISETQIQTIRDAANIVDVVGSRIELKRKSSRYVACCPFHNEKTPSFSVSPLKKIWTCFGGCSKSGDVIDFVMRYDKISFLDAIRKLSAQYGISIDLPIKEYKKPEPLKDISGIEPKTLDWFKKRGISSATLQRWKVTTEKKLVPQVQKERNVICFNHFREGELVNVQYRDAEKNFFSVGGAEMIFYGLDFIKDALCCVITEGHVDCLSFYEIGVSTVVSVPNGASSGASALDNCYEYFQDKEKVYLATDNDRPGLGLREELARRIGKERCWIINFPEGCKDANDVLVKHGREELMKCYEAAKQFPIEGIIEVNELSEAIDDLYDNGYPEGKKIGYPIFDTLLSWVPSQLTIITGSPSAGKSEFMDQIYVRLAARHNWKFGIFSPENAPTHHYFAKLASKYIGRPFTEHREYNYTKMSVAEREAAKQFFQTHFFFVNENTVNITLHGMLEKARELVIRKGIDAFVIDPWNRMEHDMGAKSENQYIGDALTEIYKFKELNNIHFFIVAHPTKMQKDKKTGLLTVPTLYDINGSAHWNNRADNGMTVYRYFDAERRESIIEVHVQKVRHKWVGHYGIADFEYDYGAGRYKEPSQMGFDREYDGKPIENEHGYPESWG